MVVCARGAARPRAADRQRPARRAAASLFLVLAVIGCSSDSSDTDASGDTTAPADEAVVEVVLEDYRFSPVTLDVGAARQVRVKNLGGLEHSWSVLAAPIETEAELVDAVVLVEARVGVGQSVTVDIGSLAPGRYQVVCTIAGHISAGMVGELVVG